MYRPVWIDQWRKANLIPEWRDGEHNNSGLWSECVRCVSELGIFGLGSRTKRCSVDEWHAQIAFNMVVMWWCGDVWGGEAKLRPNVYVAALLRLLFWPSTSVRVWAYNAVCIWPVVPLWLNRALITIWTVITCGVVLKWKSKCSWFLLISFHAFRSGYYELVLVLTIYMRDCREPHYWRRRCREGALSGIRIMRLGCTNII